MTQELLVAAAVPITCLIMAVLFAVPWVVWWIRYGRNESTRQ